MLRQMYLKQGVVYGIEYVNHLMLTLMNRILIIYRIRESLVFTSYHIVTVRVSREP